MLGDINKRFVIKYLLTKPNNVLPLHLKQTFPPIIWTFTEDEGDGTESRLPFKIFSTLPKSSIDCGMPAWRNLGLFAQYEWASSSLLTLYSMCTVCMKWGGTTQACRTTRLALMGGLLKHLKFRAKILQSNVSALKFKIMRVIIIIS